MKKSYIIPASVTVQLGTCKMMAESVIINSNYDPDDTDTYINDQDQILTKGNKSFWDEEW